MDEVTLFFAGKDGTFFAALGHPLAGKEQEQMEWLLQAETLEDTSLMGPFVGPRKEMISPWSTNAVEIAESVGLKGIKRIELFRKHCQGEYFDPMLEMIYGELDQHSLLIPAKSAPLTNVADLDAYNKEAGLALSTDEVSYLKGISNSLNRPLTDAEVYAFAQINSEHCRHKIFNGVFVIDGKQEALSLFELIKLTSAKAPELLVSAYKDNVAFWSGPTIELFTPAEYSKDRSLNFSTKPVTAVLSLKAETHNFPTTVEPFFGASTGSGGEIRDRMAGGIGSFPLAGSAVYMTSYPRLKIAASSWENQWKPRKWRYQSPEQILIKASNGASDFGNKFGQPLIVGSLFTYEGNTPAGLYAYDRTIMMAGGIGFADARHAQKLKTEKGDVLVLLGGDNYRIGMAGGSVSSVDSGELAQTLELSAVQRANPEMQKRVYNVIRALCESNTNPIKMIHDHGAGGHVNCFSELLEQSGGKVNISKLPLGDPTLSPLELLCNESQERMGLIVSKRDVPRLIEIAHRERAPMYIVGEVNDSGEIVFECDNGERSFALPLDALFGSSPQTVMEDSAAPWPLEPLSYSISNDRDLAQALHRVVTLEGVACKDWLTNKVDRSVTGLVAQQQCVGAWGLPLSNLGVMALDYRGKAGLATAIGHAPAAGLIDAKAGAVLSIAEALTNLVWAPLKDGLNSVVLSANWMWPAKQEGEDARLFRAVEACSRFAIELGIPIPTGKDSLSMTMKYPDGGVVRAPGTVIISAAAECEEVSKCVTPVLQPLEDSLLIHLDFSGLEGAPLGGSSFAQSLGQLGDESPIVTSAQLFRSAFELLQEWIKRGQVLAGHDVSSGGLLVTVSEMAFAGGVGFELLLGCEEQEIVPLLFSEKPGVVIQIAGGDLAKFSDDCRSKGLTFTQLGKVGEGNIAVKGGGINLSLPLAEVRKWWFEPSYLLDSKQSGESCARERFTSLDKTPLYYQLPEGFEGSSSSLGIKLSERAPGSLKAAIIREKGTNGDREMAYSLYAAGFDVLDVTMSDIISGNEDLSEVRFAVFPGGFADSDVLGAARGWAGIFRYNERAKEVVESFYQRPDTLSLGVCNGCQLMVALNVLYPEHESNVALERNISGKFESGFVALEIEETASIMLKPLVGCRLGAWVAHGEGRFSLPLGEQTYDIPLRYGYPSYPANPNGSEFRAAGIVSKDGRHLAMMPHLERSIIHWQWPYAGDGKSRLKGEYTPWVLAFQAAYRWLEEQRGIR